MLRRASQRKKKVIFSLLLLVLLTALLELLSFFGLLIFDRKNDLKTVSFPRDRSFYTGMEGGGTHRFDPDLGWDGPEPVRGGTRFPPNVSYFASAYGDSFTFCAEVLDGETWEDQFKQHTGRPILNMGINAGGTDQAYLKLRKYYETYPTDVVILGVLPENVSRLVNVVRAFYYLRDPGPLVKPRFEIGSDGKVTLFKNPISSVEGLRKLSNKGYLRQLATHDDWHKLHKERYGFDLVDGRTFPSIVDVFKLVRGLIKYGDGPVGYHYFLQDPSSDPYRLMTYLIHQFKARAAEYRFKPLIMIHVMKPDLESGATSDTEPLRRFIVQEVGIPALDVSRLFSTEISKGTPLDRLYQKGHYSKYGNQLVARRLERLMRRQGILR